MPVITDEIRQFIKIRRKHDGLGARKMQKEIKKEFNIQHSLHAIYNLIKKIDLGLKIDNLPRGHRPKTALTPSNIQLVKDEIEQNIHNFSQKQLSRILGISYGSVNNIIHKCLNMKAFTTKKVHKLDQKKRDQRKQRSLNLLIRFNSQKMVKKIVFSDESMFLLDSYQSFGRSYFYAEPGSFQDSDRKNVEATKFPKSVMVFAAVSFDFKMPLIFVEKGIKINSKYYQESILTPVFDFYDEKYGSGNWILQQDSAPSHSSRDTQYFIQGRAVFIDKDEWPSNSPDLNPLDFCIWSVFKKGTLRMN